MLSLDGSTLEGGGQLIRTALALSAITCLPIHLSNIRANRAPPQRRPQYPSPNKTSSKQRHVSTKPPTPSKTPEGGLKESHLAALTFLADCTDANVHGAVVASRVVDFTPSPPHPGFCLESKHRKPLPRQVEIVLQKPGSIWLIFQAVFPYLVFAGHLHPFESVGRGQGDRRIELVLKGGTNVSGAMSLEYVKQVFLVVCERIGLPRVDVEVVKRGWAGAAAQVGEVRVGMELPILGEEVVFSGFWMKERGNLGKVCVSVVAHGVVRSLLREGLLQMLGRWVGKSVEVEVVVDDDSGDERRLYVLLVAHMEGGWRLGRDFLGSGGKAKNVSERSNIVSMAVEKVVRELGAELERGCCVDEYMEDQLVVFQALAQGKNEVRVRTGEPADSKEAETGTLHTRTVRWVCESMLGTKFDGVGGCEGRREADGLPTAEEAEVVECLDKLGTKAIDDD